MLWYQVHVSTDRAFARSFWATLPHENRGGWEGCEPLQLRLDPTPSVAFGVRSRDTSQISASVCSFVSSPLRHEQTPPGRRVSGPTEEVERMPCFTAAGDGSRTQILRRSALTFYKETACVSRCGTRNSSTKRSPRVSPCRFYAVSIEVLENGKRQQTRPHKQHVHTHKYAIPRPSFRRAPRRRRDAQLCTATAAGNYTQLSRP